MDSLISYETLEGRELTDEVQIRVNRPIFGIPGDSGFIGIDEDILSKHFLLIGGIGMGKTNVFNLFVRNIRRAMTDNDVMVIFDSKGDYLEKFYQPGDIVISNDEHATHYWNIFEEVNIDSRIEENVSEISNYLFNKKIEKSSNPFFPSAAKEIFSSLLTGLLRKGDNKFFDNYALRRIIDRQTTDDYIKFFSKYDDMRGVCNYISNDAKGQTQGVMSEFQQAIREVFIGNFKKKGDFSIRKAIKNKGRKVIFIEYDLSLGSTLAPIYTLLIDLAIKEALCRKEKEGNVYFVLDEFRLLQPLDHMDNGINFGRSLGAKFLLGMQNAEQVYDVYGERAGRSILSGCSTMISFFVVDEATRSLIKERNGSNIKKLTYRSAIQTKGVVEQVMNGNTVEDWDIANLGVGEAIVLSANRLPFRFKFRRFE